MQSHPPPCGDGTRKESFAPYEHPETSGDTVQLISSECLESNKKDKQKRVNKKRRKSSTQESLRITKKKISKDKSQTYKQHTQAMKSSQILDLDSITTERASRGFWNEFTKEMSAKLWLPTKTGSVDMALNSLNGYSTNLGQNSWFTAEAIKNQTHPENLPMIFLQSATSLLQETTDEEQQTTGKEEESNKKKSKSSKDKDTNESKTPPGKVKKIRLFPDKQQRQILNQWIGTARWTYNQVLSGMMEDWTKYKHASHVLEKGNVQFDKKKLEKEYITFDKKKLRARFINNKLFEGTDNAWVIDTPYDVRDEAMIDVLKAYGSNFAKLKKNPEHRFKLKFRSKHAESQSIVIHSKHWKSAGIFHPTRWGKERLRAAESLPNDLVYDTRMVRDRLGRFYLCQILPLQEVAIDQPREQIIALDPGVRTFMTGYSPKGTITEWGKGDMQRIVRLCHTYDKIQSRLARKKGRHRTRYHLRKKVMPRIRQKIRNLVDEVHKKLTKWLVSNYETILLPKFETSQMVTRAKRRIGSKTARQMLTWSHYRFQQRLLNKTREYRGSQVIVCDEAYTSKTCGHCGKLHEKLGGNKTFKCPYCDVRMDRDVNGARNILLRYLTLNRVAPQLRSGVGS